MVRASSVIVGLLSGFAAHALIEYVVCLTQLFDAGLAPAEGDFYE